jgi:CHAD domain-containing protein
MHQRLAELTDALEQSAVTLLDTYRTEELYALRVGMRRIRSLLKPLGSTRARQFRKAWGGFAAVTNQARDWDVFVVAAQELLPPDQYGRFMTENQQAVQLCHDAVTELLLSAPWRRHLHDWRQYLERTHDHAADEFTASQPLDDALANARAALAAAQIAGDERAWHKLRIALKEVRYQAESGPGGTPIDATAAALVEQCKPLQSLLGGWHDCVVQLQLLDELEPIQEHDHLRALIGKKEAGDLAEIESTVSGHPLFEATAP